jgi:hypothetical protein
LKDFEEAVIFGRERFGGGVIGGAKNVYYGGGVECRQDERPARTTSSCMILCVHAISGRTDDTSLIIRDYIDP